MSSSDGGDGSGGSGGSGVEGGNEDSGNYRDTVKEMLRDLKRATKTNMAEDSTKLKDEDQDENSNSSEHSKASSNSEKKPKKEEEEEMEEKEDPEMTSSPTKKESEESESEVEEVEAVEEVEKVEEDSDYEITEVPKEEEEASKAGSEDEDEKEDAKSSSSDDDIVEEQVPKKVNEVVELSDDDDDDDEEENAKESQEDEEDESNSVEDGDPSREPGQDATRPIDSNLLEPFKYGWKRECVWRYTRKGDSLKDCDIYYIPHPVESKRSDAKRKRRSKKDIDRFFEDFETDNGLSSINFSFVRRPLGLNNSHYEIVRNARDGLRNKTSKVSTRRGSVNYKEVDESAGLVTESEDEGKEENSDDDDILEDFSTEIPIVLQVTRDIVGMKAEYKKRRIIKDRNRCMTPPLAEELPWSALDDDSLGIYKQVGGCSDPPTPPPLRALKLTRQETAEKIIKALTEIKDEAKKLNLLESQNTKENLASHDLQIRKFKNFVPPDRSALRSVTGYSGFNQSWPDNSRLKRPNISNNYNGGHRSNLPCTLHCPGSNGILPALSCLSCQCLFHPRCQGVPASVRNFRCRACSRARPATHMQQRRGGDIVRVESGSSDSVRVKLPMAVQNGRRPVVELVIEQSGKYQPIKFSNNMQVTEAIPCTLFEQANSLRRTVYQKATQVPRVGGKQIYLAINPSSKNNPGANRLPLRRPKPLVPSSSRSDTLSDQVSILVRPQKDGSKPVLLNVPRKIAIKVKSGTTLSFSASSDQKYTVIDNKIHPPVGTKKPTPAPQRNNAPLIPSPSRLGRYGGLTVSRVTDNKPTALTRQIPKGISILPATASSNNQRRRPQSSSTIGQPPSKVRKVGSVLSTGEIIRGSGQTDLSLTPCTPYCPGVSGFPEMECTGCQSLFHSKCVGIPSNAVQRVKSTFKCRMCSGAGQTNSSPQEVIDLD